MRKGQAAMEFLMTYGWAILVVLAAIGALAYFGVLSPDRFLPDKCTASPPFTCSEYKAAGTTVTLVLQNNAGYDMTYVNVSMEGCTGRNDSSYVIRNGETYKHDMINCATAGKTKWKANFNITYVPTEGTVVRTVTGNIQTRVE